MNTFLVLCPSHRDHRELARLDSAVGDRFIFHDYASVELEEMVAPTPQARVVRNPEEEIAQIVATYGGAVDAVVSTDDYPGSTLATIVAQRLGLAGAAPAADLLCQHKYHSRVIQQRALPAVVPAFALLDSSPPAELGFPLFIKPVKSFFSIGAYRVNDTAALDALTPRAVLPPSFFAPFSALLKKYAGVSIGRKTVLAERLLTGAQATFEGYAFAGEIHAIGVVDSIFYPGTLSFERFEYPSSLPAGVQGRMADVARIVMRAIGLEHGLFNIEFIYDPERDSLHIIEINPRMVSQFADLHEKVDGFNTYSVLLDLGLGKTPAPRYRQGPHAFAASCVLRRFRDAHVLRVPSAMELRAIQRAHRHVRFEILASEGRRLSHDLQDGVSFRYGIVSIGGSSRDEVVAEFDRCREDLPFAFADCGSHYRGSAGTAQSAPARVAHRECSPDFLPASSAP